MATYREPMQTFERGAPFVSPFCAFGAPGSIDSMKDRITGPGIKRDDNEGAGMKFLPKEQVYEIPTIPQSSFTYLAAPNEAKPFVDFPTYRDMLSRRVYIPGHQIVEDEIGYPIKLLAYRQKKSEEFNRTASIQLAENISSLEKAA